MIPTIRSWTTCTWPTILAVQLANTLPDGHFASARISVREFLDSLNRAKLIVDQERLQIGKLFVSPSLPTASPSMLAPGSMAGGRRLTDW